MNYFSRTIALLWVALLSAVILQAQPYRGSVAGTVIDAKTREPIPGVHVAVKELPNVGAPTDLNGEFHIRDLSVGSYSLQISAVG